MRSKYKELGLELVHLEEAHQWWPKLPLMQGLIKMMDNFIQIIRPILAASTGSSMRSSGFGGDAPFKVQVNINILVFEDHIDVEALNKWLYFVQVYLYVHNFSNTGYIVFMLLEAVPCVKDLLDTCEKISVNGIHVFGGDCM